MITICLIIGATALFLMALGILLDTDNVIGTAIAVLFLDILIGFVVICGLTPSGETTYKRIKPDAVFRTETETIATAKEICIKNYTVEIYKKLEQEIFIECAIKHNAYGGEYSRSYSIVGINLEKNKN